MDRIITQAGWNFFYIAGVLETNTFGSDEKMTTRKAIKQVMGFVLALGVISFISWGAQNFVGYLERLFGAP